jgi:hypothetical protein
MTPEQLEALRKAHRRGMAPHWHKALADELFAEVDRLRAELAQAREHPNDDGAWTRLVAERDQLIAHTQRVETERDRALKVIRQAVEAGDDAWRICADALHPTDPTRLAETRQP